MSPKNAKIVGFKTLEPSLDMVLCHIFLCTGKSQGMHIAQALNASFESAAGSSRKAENNKRNASSVASQTGINKTIGTYDGIYVGKMAVSVEEGDEVVKDAVKRLMESNEKTSDPVAIVVSAENLKVIDTFQGNVMFKQYMRTITYSKSRTKPPHRHSAMPCLALPCCAVPCRALAWKGVQRV